MNFSHHFPLLCSVYRLTQFQELIAEQTEIVSNNQLLIYDGQILTETVKPLQPVTEYPKGITENNPIVCFNKAEDDSYKFPDFTISKCSLCICNYCDTKTIHKFYIMSYHRKVKNEIFYI